MGSTLLERESAEVSRTDCFLCNPDTSLVFHKTGNAFALAGLGPIVDGYSVVATSKHVASLAEMAREELEEFCAYAENIRLTLTRQYGSCVLTEHGKMGLCALEDQTKSAVEHCFHQHFLLFPGAPSILEGAEEYMGKPREFPSLVEAVRAGARLDQYLLISSEVSRVAVFVPVAERLPRQFARLLVAETTGNEDAASWRDRPQYEEARRIAAKHRELLSK